MTRVLLATAELDPFVKIGGLGETVAGLAACLSQLGVDVHIAVPDYPISLAANQHWSVQLPAWASSQASVRSGRVPGLGTVHAVGVHNIERPHPYYDPATGESWFDNDRRFFAFGIAVAKVARQLNVDVLHINDWHTATAVADFPNERTIFTIHNLAHQGAADIGWLPAFGDKAPYFEHLGSCNPMAAAIRLSAKVSTVSPRYAIEACSPTFGCGLQDELAARGSDFFGVRNGIDPKRWNPESDVLLPANFSARDLAGKQVCNKELRRATGLGDAPGPIIGMVTRFADQKGIDLVADLVGYLEGIPASLVMHGTGEVELVSRIWHEGRARRSHMSYLPGFDEQYAHLVVAGSDLLLIPSKFEPCGLTQMQAMTCGTIPVVTGVGGLADTVIDTDADPTRGTGFVSGQASVTSVLDSLHRAVRGWRNRWRREAIQRRGMLTDWTWAGPGRRYRDLYREVLDDL